jgi:CRISPR-associated protein Cmr6
MADETRAIRPTSKAINDVLGELPSGPFNYGLYFNKWMYVVDGRFNQERLLGKGWACSESDETKLVKDRQKVCDPNQRLDNFNTSICLFNEEGNYTRKSPKEIRKQEGPTSYREEESQVTISAKWKRTEADALLKTKHVALDKTTKAYEILGYKAHSFRARLIAPLVIGLGNEHPTEKGFRFDWNMGVPYIPATGIKGVVRLAYLVNCLNDLDEEDAQYFADRVANGLLNEDAKDTFGCAEELKNHQVGQRGGIIFFDAYPESLPRLAPEIMNCHYPEYLNKLAERGPTEDQQPNPMKYWAVSAWADANQTKPLVFVFRMLVSKELSRPSHLEKITAAFHEALQVYGLGAKTALGHGHFELCEESSSALPPEDGSGTEPHGRRNGVSSETSEHRHAIEASLVEKFLMDLSRIKKSDMGRIGTVIQHIEMLPNAKEKGLVATAIREHIGPQVFKKHKRRDYLLGLIQASGIEP